MKILFCGCSYGAGNIGDDAILLGLVDSFRRRFPKVSLGALSFNPEMTRKHVSLDACWDVGRSGCLAGFDWASHIVLGGGSIITDFQGLDFPVGYCCDLIDLAVMKKKPIAMLGAGAGDLRNSKTKQLIVSSMSRFLDVVAVRTPGDRDFLVELGFLPEKVYVAADASLCLFPVIGKIGWMPSQKIAVNMVDENREGIPSFAREMASALGNVCKSFDGLKIEGVCSEVRHEKWADYFLTREVVRSLNDDGMVFDQYTSVVDFTRLLAGYRLVVTMRMHILIFCAMIGVPCIAVTREVKMDRMLKMLGLPDGLTLQSRAMDIERSIKNAIDFPSQYTVDRKCIANISLMAEKNADVWINNIEGLVASCNCWRQLKSWLRWSISSGEIKKVSWTGSQALRWLLPCCFSRSRLVE